MIYYLGIFFSLVILNFIKPSNISLRNLKIINYFTLIIIIIFTGLRYKVGADWEVYEYLFNSFKNLGFPSIAIFKSSDPLYIVLNIFADRLGSYIYLVNITISTIYFLALYSIAVHLSGNKIGTIYLISSYLLIIVILNMGYTRQALASGFILYFYYNFFKKNYLLSLSCFLLSVLSHKTSLIVYLMILVTFVIENKDLLKISFKNFFSLILIVIAALFFFFIYEQDILRLIDVYVVSSFGNNQYPSLNIKQPVMSEGVIFKLLYLYFFVGLFFLYKKKIFFINKNEKIIFYSLIIPIIGVGPFIGYFSSFVDRILVYHYFFPIFVTLKILNVENFKIKEKKIKIETTIIIFSFIALLAWLIFANHSKYWINYDNYIFGVLF